MRLIVRKGHVHKDSKLFRLYIFLRGFIYQIANTSPGSETTLTTWTRADYIFSQFQIAGLKGVRREALVNDAS